MLDTARRLAQEAVGGLAIHLLRQFVQCAVNLALIQQRLTRLANILLEGMRIQHQHTTALRQTSSPSPPPSRCAASVACVVTSMRACCADWRARSKKQ